MAAAVLNVDSRSSTLPVYSPLFEIKLSFYKFDSSVIYTVPWYYIILNTFI